MRKAGAHRRRRRRPAEPLTLLQSAPWRTKKPARSGTRSSTPRPRRGGGLRSRRSGSTPTRSCGCGRARSRTSTTTSAGSSSGMTHLMQDANGVGLAGNAGRRPAPRLRLPARHRAGAGDRRQPELRRPRREERESDDEGCLSLQGVRRSRSSGHVSLTLEGKDAEGNDVRLELEGLPRADRPARARPSRRRADPRPHDARGPARGARRCCGRSRSSSGRCGSASRRPRRSAPTCSSGSPRKHEIAFLLTRPDRPQGRGRKLAPPPAKETAERLGIDVRQPERLGRLRSGGRHGGRRRLRRADPGGRCSTGALWLNVHPSLLPRWRGAAPIERALMAGDDGDRRHDHRARAGARRRADRGAAGVPARAGGRRRHGLGAGGRAGGRAARGGAAGADARAAARRGRRPTPRRSAPRTASSTWSRPPQELLNRIRALSPHIGARGELHGRPVTVWRARVEGGELVPVEVQPDGRQAHGLRRVPARPAVSVSPARRAAFEVVRRVFEDDAYADRAFRGRGRGLDPRERALAQRLAYGTVQRVRTLDHGIEALGRRPVRKLDPPVRAALRLGAYQLAYSEVAVARGGERVGRARPRGAGSSGRSRSRTRSCGGWRSGCASSLEALPEATPEEAALQPLVSRTGSRRPGGATSGADEALALMRAQNEPPETRRAAERAPREPVDGGEPTDDPGRAAGRAGRRLRRSPRGFVWPQSRGSQLAGLAVGAQPGERVLDLCAAPGGKATQLAGRRSSRSSSTRAAPASWRRTSKRLGATNVRVVNADALALPADLDGFDRALVDAPCSGLGVLAARPDLRWRGEPLPGAPARPAARRRPSACGRAARSSTRSARSTPTRTRRSSTRPASSPRRSARSGRSSRHPTRPEFLLTLPHRHRTSGFFIARLRSSRAA